MKTLIGLVLSLALLGSAAPALASGNTAFTAQYTVSYTSPMGGNWNCTGMRIANQKFTKDVFNCTITDLSTMPAGTYTQDNVTWGWLSDYQWYAADSFRLIVRPNGQVEGVAFYNTF